MNSPTCPLCETPVPSEVLIGPPITVFRCGGCSKVLTWRGGRAIASASAIAQAKAEPRKPARAPAPNPSALETVGPTELMPSLASDAQATAPVDPVPAPPAVSEAVPALELSAQPAAGEAGDAQQLAPSPGSPAPAASSSGRARLGAALLGVALLAGATWAFFSRRGGEAPAPPPPVAQPEPKRPAVETVADVPPPEPEPAPEPEPTPPAPPPPQPEPRPAAPAKPAPSRPLAAAHAGPLLGGKRVVLEYDKGAEGDLALPADAAAAVGRARTHYQQGNAKLFSGDTEGAVAAYQQSLKAYPGYVAGHRGLGLAYKQQRDDARALAAFKIYVKTVPAARDAALIKKVIAKLEADAAPAKP